MPLKWEISQTKNFIFPYLFIFSLEKSVFKVGV